jgi:hypothetical protein
MSSTLKTLEEAIERATGKTADELRRTPLTQQPAYQRWLTEKAVSIRDGFIYIVSDVRDYFDLIKLKIPYHRE